MEILFNEGDEKDRFELFIILKQGKQQHNNLNYSHMHGLKLPDLWTVGKSEQIQETSTTCFVWHIHLNINFQFQSHINDLES